MVSGHHSLYACNRITSSQWFQKPLNYEQHQSWKIQFLRYSFHYSVMNQKGLNPSLIDLITKILVNQTDRITIAGIMSHPWMTMKLTDKKLNINFMKIKKYSQLSKVFSIVTQFKILVLNFLASQLPQKDIMILGQVFMSIDQNKDGYLTVEQLSNYMKSQIAKPELQQIGDIIKHMDVDFNGKLVYN